jgi:hypothetical protein
MGDLQSAEIEVMAHRAEVDGRRGVIECPAGNLETGHLRHPVGAVNSHMLWGKQRIRCGCANHDPVGVRPWPGGKVIAVCCALIRVRDRRSAVCQRKLKGVGGNIFCVVGLTTDELRTRGRGLPAKISRPVTLCREN